MDAEIFAEWLRRQDYRVVRTASSFWYEVSSGIYQAFPYHWIISPGQEEINELLLRNHAIGVRYSTGLESPLGAMSYHVVYEGDGYDLDILEPRMRTKVRKGLYHTKVEQVTFDMLADQGWQLRLDTLLRQGRANAESRSWWARLCSSAKDLPGLEAWGAFYNDQMVAAVLVFICEDTSSILYHQSLTEHLKDKVNNALAFTVTSNLLSRRGISRVFYGLHSLDAPASVDEFKFHMRYTAKPVRQRVVFHPLFRPFVNKASHAVLQLGGRILPGNSTLSKAEGLFRFYLQGQMPISEQTKPAALRGAVL